MRKTPVLLVLATLGLLTALAINAAPAGAAMPPGWSPTTQIEDDSTPNDDTYQQVLAVDHNGKTLAAWGIHSADIGYSVIAYAWYTPGVGWSPPSYVIDECWASNLDSPAVAVSADGTFALVWANHDSSYICYGPAIWYMVWEPGAVEPTYPAVLASAILNAYDPKLGIDAGGNMIAVWRSSDGVQVNATAARYTPAGGWSAPQTIDNQATSVNAPRVAVDPTGNAVAVWRQSDGTTDRAYANRYTVASGWGTPQTVDAGQFDVDEIEIAMDASGHAIIAFDQHNGTRERVYVNHFSPTAGWAGLSAISIDNNQAIFQPSIACNAAGQYVVAWSQYTGTYYNTFAATYSSAGGWSAATNVTPSDAMHIFPRAYSAAVMAGGTAFVMVYYDVGNNNAMAVVQASPGAAWGAPQEVWNQSSVNTAAFAVGGEQIVALMESWNGMVTNLYASVYTPPDVTNPALTIAGPADGATSPTPTVLVYGTVETGAKLWVNHVQVESTPAGPASNWSVLVALVPGSNTIVAYAMDAAGNDAEVTIAVVYNDPVPGLNSQIAAANAQLADTQADLAAAQTSLATAQGQITTLQGALATAQANQTAGDSALQGKVDSAAGSASTAMLVGLLGLLVGVAGIAMGFMMSRKGAPKPPAEPPKAP